MARLGDICEKVTDYVASGSFAALKENVLITNEENYAIMVKTADFANGFTKGLTYTDKHGYDFLRNSNLFGGELILSNIGSIGKVFKVPRLDRPMTLASNTVMIKTATPELTDYLYYYFLSPAGYKNLLSISSGTSMLKFNKTELKKLDVPVPAIDEQRRIIAVMDKISGLIALRKEQLAKLDQLVKSRFVEMFGDPVDNPKSYLVKSLQELSDMGYITYHLDGNHGGDYPRSEEFVNSGVPYIGANCIVNGEIDFSMAKHLTQERAGKLRKGIAQNDDVLFAHNATVGPTVVLHTTESKVILSTSLTAYRCNKAKLLPNYLKAYMQSEGFIRQYSNEMKQTTRNQVPITAQKRYLFLVPPIMEQERFATFVEQTDKIKLTIHQGLDKLEVMKKALMQQYFG